MRRYGAAMLSVVMLLFCSCGQQTAESSQPTVTVVRSSSIATITTETETSAATEVETTRDETTKNTVAASSASTDMAQTTTTVTKVTSTTKTTVATSTAVIESIEPTTTTTEAEIGITVTTTAKTTVPKVTIQSTTTEKVVTTLTSTVIVTTTTQQSMITPSADGEVRGAWVSFIEVAEMLQQCSTPAQARKALDEMMQQLVANRINTVFFHVRANSDAYYKSTVFQPAAAAKKLLDAGFDPLEYAVQAAHKRNIELHAWINPYRVGTNAVYAVDGVPTLTDQTGRYYYVPTSSEAQSLILRGVREILEKYDVDGIQYDDYFYPEGLLEENTVYGFESGDYDDYCQSGGTLSVGDWRRAGVDALISGTHVLTSSHKVVFGVSPAVNADNTYTALYADCRKWLSQEGFVDYLCPQIYTGFEHGVSPFDAMVDVWNTYPRHESVELYVGLALYKIGLRSDDYAGAGKTEWRDHDDVMQRSVEYLRRKEIRGICLYSYSYLYPEDKTGLSQTTDVTVAKNEIRNLLSIW